MSFLVNEILLRFVKPIAAGVIGAILYFIAVGPAGAAPSFELAALCWVSGAAGILLAESSPL